jgi:hypothetical protein
VSKGKVRSLFIAMGLTSVMVAGVQPVLADTELGHNGTVGVHSLADTSSNPGATCKYKFLPSWDFGKLVRIFVKPPKMRAVAGKDAQTVGWTFTVQRRIFGITGSGPWVDRYTSPEMMAVTDDAHNATFSQSSVSVTVPFGPGAEDVVAVYRVKVKMFWHRANGSIQGTARHRVDYYHSTMTNGDTGLQPEVCGAFWSPDWA